MNITFLRNPDGTPRSLVYVSPQGVAKTVARDNPNWAKIYAAVEAGDETLLQNLISIKRSVETFGNTGNIQVREGSVFFRGEKLFGEDVNRILSYLKGGFPADSMIKFLESKVRNVSPASVASLYNFLENKEMPITANGTVLGFKGIRDDYFSVHTGAEPLISGIRRADGAIRNQIGDVNWMERRYVNCNASESCGPGLHVGSRRYAKGWGPRVMVVEFLPEHVGMVPNHACEVLRVEKYRVVGELNEADYLGEVFNDDYSRPNETPEPPSKIVVPIEKVKAKQKNCFNISAWTKGHVAGEADGRAHAKRKFYEVDNGSSFRNYSKEFVKGYLVGYKAGRK